MSKVKPFGIVCKGCHAEITLGSCLTPEKPGDLITFVVVEKAGPFKCSKCGETHSYDQGDLREF
jgi:hypothetical protein